MALLISKRLLGLTAILALISVTAFADDKKKDPDEIGNRDVGKGVNLYSMEKEIALGKQLAQEVERQAKIIDDPIIAEYVNRVGQNLVRNSDAKVPFTIKVIDTEDVNAFALPGGFFFVNSGLILKADSEAELAGVMAHEIAHVAARHGTRQATRGQVAQPGHHSADLHGRLGRVRHPAGGQRPDPGGLPAILQGVRDPRRTCWACSTCTRPATIRKRSWTSSKRSSRWKRRSRGRMAKVFSTHPPTDDRIVAAQKNIQEMLKERPEYVVTTSEFNDVKGRLAMLHNRRKVDSKDLNRPRLKKAPGSGTTTDDGGGTKGSDDDRPTLKRRPDGSSQQ